jgi:hypothetical protein
MNRRVLGRLEHTLHDLDLAGHKRVVLREPAEVPLDVPQPNTEGSNPSAEYVAIVAVSTFGTVVSAFKRVAG